MILILADHHIEGQAALLWRTVEQLQWLELVEMRLTTFRAVGLSVESSDRVIWRFVQQHGMLLLTANRNMEGDDSLEQTLRDKNMPTAMPVLTVGSIGRLGERAYRERCAERLAEIVFDLDRYLGVGRLFIP